MQTSERTFLIIKSEKNEGRFSINLNIIRFMCYKVKVKVTLVQALRLCTGLKAHSGSRGIALPFHDHRTRRRSGFSITTRPLFTPGKNTVPLHRRLGGPQGQSGQVRKISPPSDLCVITLLCIIRFSYDVCHFFWPECHCVRLQCTRKVTGFIPCVIRLTSH